MRREGKERKGCSLGTGRDDVLYADADGVKDVSCGGEVTGGWNAVIVPRDCVLSGAWEGSQGPGGRGKGEDSSLGIDY